MSAASLTHAVPAAVGAPAIAPPQADESLHGAHDGHDEGAHHAGNSWKGHGRAEDAAPADARTIDWGLFITACVLLLIGVVMVLSASGIVAESRFGDKYFFFKRQCVYAFIGMAGLAIAVAIPRDFLYRMTYPALFICLLLLLITLSPLSPSVNGAHRWIRVGPVQVQPMEFVKIALAMYLAYFMSEKRDMVKTFTRGVIPPFAVTILFCFILLLQPDFGSCMVLAALLFFMCIAGGTRFVYIFFAVLLAAAAVVPLVLKADYRMRRLLAFLDPFKDARGAGYQLVQSLYAIGSGSLWGVGLGASRQKMFYLPEAHNDFIMAVLAEELGLVGVTAVMALFALFFWRCYRIIMGQENLRDRYTVFAITIVMCLAVVLNLAVVMGVAPPKGVPMPFLSYGGSNLVATLLSVGLILNFSKTVKRT